MKEYKQQKPSVIIQSNTAVDPYTVMVKFFHTYAASLTVLSAFLYITQTTVAKETLLLYLEPQNTFFLHFHETRLHFLVCAKPSEDDVLYKEEDP